MPSAGLLILRDGDPGDPEVTLSPLRHHSQHRAKIEAKAPRPVDLPVEGSVALKAAVVPIVLTYSMDDPLS